MQDIFNINEICCMLDYVAGPATRGFTDEKGKVEISGPAYFTVRVVATKEGYYQSEKKVPVNLEKDRDVSLVLRPKRNPIPMFGKKVLLSAIDNRKSGIRFGYDFQVGDFVAPYGKGVVNDILITHTYDNKDYWDYSYKFLIEFSNPGDGVIPFYFEQNDSEFKSEYLAPESGYLSNFVIEGESQNAKSGEKGNRDDLRNYYFRVRTKTDGKGGVVSSIYGKIYGEFPEIKYYLNPSPGDRNVEFDPKKNLFKKLSNEEDVWMP